MHRRYYLFQRNKVVFKADMPQPHPVSFSELEMICPDQASVIVPDPEVMNGFAAAELPEHLPLPSGYADITLRSLVGLLDDDAFSLWSKASQLLHWYKSNRFCGSCGKVTIQHPSELARSCPSCSARFYPVISPCIIVLIHRPNEILLARSPRFPTGMYSTLAGFVEPAESAEQTLHREVYEEVGIRVANLRYFSSQPWPFPCQLMLGFFAEYLTGEIRIDNDEISDAGWYPLDRLPQIPGSMTISGQLIRYHLQQNGKKPPE